MCSQCVISQKRESFQFAYLQCRWRGSAVARVLIMVTDTHCNKPHTHTHTQSSGRWPPHLWHPTISEQMFRGWMLCFVSNENGCWNSQERLAWEFPRLIKCPPKNQCESSQSVARPVSLEETCYFGRKLQVLQHSLKDVWSQAIPVA